MRIHLHWMGALVGLCLVGVAGGQTTQPVLLGQPYRSIAAGIQVSPPLGTTTVRGAVGSPEVVRFVDEKNKTVVKLSRVVLEPDKPLPLTAWKKDNQVYPGMLELTAEQFKSDLPGAEELRRDTTTINGMEVGMLAAKFNYGLETNLTQQAIFRSSDLQYFIVAMTSPAPREGDLQADPGVQRAVATFAAVIESVRQVDQTALEKDRDDRLRTTRGFLFNITETKLRTALRRGQWLRVMQNGKDVGYSYVVEEIGRDLPRKGEAASQSGSEGVRVGIRSRMLGENGGRVDSETWSFSTFDRKYEAFSATVYTDSPQTGKVISGEIGYSRQRQRPVAVAPGIGQQRPEMDLSLEYKLEVTRLGRNVSGEPIIRELPPYYLPEAIGHLLPRLVDRRRPEKLLFATWVSEAGQVMYRYIDVETEQDANLNGRRVRAIVVTDRIGLEGPVTTHYVSPQGEYLGSISPETRTTVVATDEATLNQIWKDANLTRPGDVER